MLEERGTVQSWGRIRKEGKEVQLPGPLLASGGPKHPEEPVRPSPHRAVSWAGKDVEPQCRIRARGGSERGGGSPEALHKVWSQEALSWRDLGLGGGR